MAILRSKKFRVGLTIFATLALTVVVSGFALSRGYLIHFLFDNQSISREQFYSNAFAPTDQQLYMHCVQGDWTPGWLYVYEAHCFSSDAAAEAYIQQHFGSS